MLGGIEEESMNWFEENGEWGTPDTIARSTQLWGLGRQQKPCYASISVFI